MVEITTLGSVIKPTYEGQPNTNAFTDAEKVKLSEIPPADDIATLSDIPDVSGLVPDTRQINGYNLTENITVNKSDVGLGNVDNTSDENKPVSIAQQNALNLKISSDVTGITGAIAITNLVEISQEDYDALDPSIQDANAFIIPEA